MKEALTRASVRRVGHLRVAAAYALVARARARLATLRAHARDLVYDPEVLRTLDPERLSEDERLCIVMHFFDLHSGFPLNLPMGYGFGQGIIDFLSWEIGSGRLDEATGSRWWRIVNGAMALDLAQADLALAHGATSSADPVVDAWLAYARCADSWNERARSGYLARAQALFWTAHQRSLHRGLERAEPCFRAEPLLERAFIDRIVLHNVDFAALANDPSFLDAIALYTFALYPLHRGAYGATRSDLARCFAARIETIPLSRCYGSSYSNIGRTSSRWHTVQEQERADIAPLAHVSSW